MDDSLGLLLVDEPAPGGAGDSLTGSWRYTPPGHRASSQRPYAAGECDADMRTPGGFGQGASSSMAHLVGPVHSRGGDRRHWRKFSPATSPASADGQPLACPVSELKTDHHLEATGASWRPARKLKQLEQDSNESSSPVELADSDSIRPARAQVSRRKRRRHRNVGAGLQTAPQADDNITRRLADKLDEQDSASCEQPEGATNKQKAASGRTEREKPEGQEQQVVAYRLAGCFESPSLTTGATSDYFSSPASQTARRLTGTSGARATTIYENPAFQEVTRDVDMRTSSRPQRSGAGARVKPNRPEAGYYYAASMRPSSIQQALSSQASSQRTNDETYDESPANTEQVYALYSRPESIGTGAGHAQSLASGEPEFHFYQSLVEPSSWRHSLMEPQQRTNNALVCDEPLIRASNWTHKTLIDPRRPPAALSHWPTGLASTLGQGRAAPPPPPASQAPGPAFLVDHKSLGSAGYGGSLLATSPSGQFPPSAYTLGSSKQSGSGMAFKLSPGGVGRRRSSRLKLAASVALVLSATFLLLVLLLRGASMGPRAPLEPEQQADQQAAATFLVDPNDSVRRKLHHQDSVIQQQLQQQQPPNQATNPLASDPAGPELDLWLDSPHRQRLEQLEASCNTAADCSNRGQCELGRCLCARGFSGPRCLTVGCPEDCSGRGVCRLRPDRALSHLGGAPEGTAFGRRQSLGFATLEPASSRDCSPSNQQSTNNSFLVFQEPGRLEALFDARLEWRCDCGPGFTGATCARATESVCDDGRDDDADGLVDCEDDDCCGQAACRDSHLCLESQEPARVAHAPLEPSWLNQRLKELANGEPVASSLAFLARMRFIVRNESIQSYAQERLIDEKRAALIRGRVVGPDGQSGLLGVRVSLAESAQLGFTLTRRDGHFDMLVNGQEWVTLRFHRNSFSPVERRVFVPAGQPTSLQEDVPMAPNGPQGTSTRRQTTDADPFGLQLRAQLNKLIAAWRRDDEAARLHVLACIYSSSLLADAHLSSPLGLFIEPKLILSNHNSTNYQAEQMKNSQQFEPLRSFVPLASSGEAFSMQLPLSKQNDPLSASIAYNSATFPPASSVVKPTVNIQLLPKQLEPSILNRLDQILVHLDIEGQSKRDQLAPVEGLAYQFAWNRRDLYERKVYGFSQLTIRVGYKLKPHSWLPDGNWTGCLEGFGDTGKLRQTIGELASNTGPTIRWFQRYVYLEAHSLNHHADVAKWNLDVSNRLDLQRGCLYFGSGWTLPMALAYPPTLSGPISLGRPDLSAGQTGQWPSPRGTTISAAHADSRLLARGPQGTMFALVPGQQSVANLVQLDAGARRKLLDIPLANLVGRFLRQTSPANWMVENNFQVIFNSQTGFLYLSSRAHGEIVQMSYANLIQANRSGSFAELEIEPLCGQGRQLAPSSGDPVKACHQIRLVGPHSMSLDEQRQLLYFIDEPANLLALDLASLQVVLVVLPNVATNGAARSIQTNSDCPRESPALSFRARAPIQLAWSQVDESLYFVDQKSLWSLRPGGRLELIARGTSSELPAACWEGAQLGLIKALAIDQARGELLIAHLWLAGPLNDDDDDDRGRSSAATSHTIAGELAKTVGRVYLAKLALGFGSEHFRRRPLDLHSARATWDPLVWRLAGRRAPADRPTSIDWPRLAQSKRQSGSASPFIHLSGGLGRLDSIEISPDGSIFVLDYEAHSIRLIEAYSVLDYNLAPERPDVNINRLFAIGASPLAGGLHNQAKAGPNLPSPPPLQVLMVQNPIANDLMEFHSPSGLQISLTRPQNGTRLEFYYRILTNDNLASGSEDDLNDLEAQRVLFSQQQQQQQHYKQPQAAKLLRSREELASRSSPPLTHLAGSEDSSEVSIWQRLQAGLQLVRLNRISETNSGSQLELVRSFTGQRLVVQSIMMNGDVMCEIGADYLGVLSALRMASNRHRWLEFLYDTPATYLLKDVVSTAYSHNTNNQSAAIRNSGATWRQIRRIVYDRIFDHYCQLFSVNT